MRIISLIASSTEIVCALGAREQLVGISHECDYPPDVEGLPVLSRPREGMPGGGSSEAAFRDAGSVFEIDEEKFSELRPDVVVTQDLCDVCAVTPGDLRDAASRLVGHELQLVSLGATRLGELPRELFDALMQCGDIFTVVDRPRVIVLLQLA